MFDALMPFILTSRHQTLYSRIMRTTLTLDDDVAARLERLRKKRDASFKKLVNDVMRSGLDRLEAPQPERRKPFRTRTHDGGVWLAPGKTPKDILREMDEAYDRQKLSLK